MLKSKQIAATISVFGKVQGVGFRFYTNKKAKELNICGYVLNKSNGSVYIEAEGTKANLDSFIDWCKTGPQWARVSRVEVQHVPPLNSSIFSIK
ncbi:MAG: acylphosphatase [Lentimicrobiaceae bacterium]|jgi:acylphosphatase|nr:acylphosphatase [Lentimicrobiaceae bacterium]MCP4909666.1 acylphosphatase [Bacteroidota bacterium]MBT3454743.1 acylphosphatase [Lentimicrobiaceae bacterium]MBT3819653.1 acylphosphatase [Lentimicrobiaceae bacterium]MBT4061269.1 acylphosphatase [Lentimicrobiaceae bacterium]